MKHPWWWNRLMLELDKRWFLQILVIVNFVGTLYGYYWYKNQLAVTEGWLKLFVPDSPTASAAFTLVLVLYIVRKRSPFWEAFAGVTLFKYGIWAVTMILAAAARSPEPFLESLQWTDWMLMISHLGMALEGVLYSRFFTFGIKELILVGGWTLLNDILDYGLNIHPWLSLSLRGTEEVVAAFTLGLSLFSILLFALLVFPAKQERKWNFPLWVRNR